MDQLYAGTQSIARAMAVLKSLGPEAGALTPQQISQQVGLNRSTVYRILSALEHEGLIAADDAGRYVLGPELVVLGSMALRQMNLRQVALPFMRDLARRSGETIDLEVLRGADVLIIEEMPGDHLLSASSNVGTTYPAHCTSTGKLLLAHLPPAALAAIIDGDLCACGPRTLTDPAALRAELQSAAARGYATSYEELEAHLHAIGAPIFDHMGRAVAAIGISGPSARLPHRRERGLARMLIDTCAQVSHTLGYRAPENVRRET
jgi:IclR family transcriptional regulator, acetate operon repressor